MIGGKYRGLHLYQLSVESTHSPRHGRACPGHPRLWSCSVLKTWMPATSAGMTSRESCVLVLAVVNASLAPRLPCLLAHKRLEISLLTFGLARTPVSEPFVGGRKAGPSGNGCSQVYRLPKGMPRRFVELGELREECIDEFCSLFVSHRAFLPVERNQDGNCGNCINHPFLCDQRRIVFVSHRSRQIGRLERFIVGYGDKPQAPFRLDIHKCWNRYWA